MSRLGLRLQVRGFGVCGQRAPQTRGQCLRWIAKVAISHQKVEQKFSFFTQKSARAARRKVAGSVLTCVRVHLIIMPMAVWHIPNEVVDVARGGAASRRRWRGRVAAALGKFTGQFPVGAWSGRAVADDGGGGRTRWPPSKASTRPRGAMSEDRIKAAWGRRRRASRGTAGPGGRATRSARSSCRAGSCSTRDFHGGLPCGRDATGMRGRQDVRTGG